MMNYILLVLSVFYFFFPSFIHAQTAKPVQDNIPAGIGKSPASTDVPTSFESVDVLMGHKDMYTGGRISLQASVHRVFNSDFVTIKDPEIGTNELLVWITPSVSQNAKNKIQKSSMIQITGHFSQTSVPDLEKALGRKIHSVVASELKKESVILAAEKIKFTLPQLNRSK